MRGMTTGIIFRGISIFMENEEGEGNMEWTYEQRRGKIHKIRK